GYTGVTNGPHRLDECPKPLRWRIRCRRTAIRFDVLDRLSDNCLRFFKRSPLCAGQLHRLFDTRGWPIGFSIPSIHTLAHGSVAARVIFDSRTGGRSPCQRPGQVEAPGDRVGNHIKSMAAKARRILIRPECKSEHVLVGGRPGWGADPPKTG